MIQVIRNVYYIPLCLTTFLSPGTLNIICIVQDRQKMDNRQGYYKSSI